ncbi:MAG TPA: GNAT family N-acetyltransferase [Noviherbaspirillum sp.]|jgi:GNAT superfamily N-acetyltransferase|uniref:GNAT family N-acetyltransferase n=1 Tax=Noviherbaspirillum sp. TaxID=1926288 RepID=UPI002DDCCA4C|nr:GNAT family N-acetyltransferase [Noviherbaspirillum sp.]HEV2610533.1 GNAT family N-acetyltransferase [Noviherbaspirillum sp.]
MDIDINLADSVEESEVLMLYRANRWSSADKPEQLLAALSNSHSLVTARRAGRLIGLGNAISDGHLVVYYPHLLVHPEFQRQGIGGRMMSALRMRYAGFHQQMLVADGKAIGFYQSVGFHPAGRTLAMWIYAGTEH